MSALTEQIAAEHWITLHEGWHCVGCGFSDIGPTEDYALASRLHLAEVTEAAVREQVATAYAETARQYNATYLRMNDAVIAHEAHDFDRDDVIRYGAYVSAWNSAARTAKAVQ